MLSSYPREGVPKEEKETMLIAYACAFCSIKINPDPKRRMMLLQLRPVNVVQREEGDGKC